MLPSAFLLTLNLHMLPMIFEFWGYSTRDHVLFATGDWHSITIAFVHWSQFSPEVALLKLEGSSVDATSAVGGLIGIDDWGTLITNRRKSPSQSSFASPSSWSTAACFWDGFAMLSTLSTTALATLCVIIAIASAASRLVMLCVWGGRYVCSPVTDSWSSPVTSGCSSP